MRITALMVTAGVTAGLLSMAVVFSLPAPGEPPPEAIWLDGGTFNLGSGRGLPEESPQQRVSIDGFWMDRYPVTTAKFSEFVDAISYVSLAERKIPFFTAPGLPPTMLEPASIVFRAPAMPIKGGTPLPAMSWWQLVPDANWRQPQGPGTGGDHLATHPVTQVAYEDAEAYCDWRGMRLPTEAEFEYASRGGLEGRTYSWGDEPKHRREKKLNYWQGNFPFHNTAQDGYELTSPAGSFPPNGFGLYDMAGNVWEWVSDWYAPGHHGKEGSHNPRGVGRNESFDPAEPGTAKRVIKGGSYLCSEGFCAGFRPSARMAADPDSPTSHTGFRCARSTARLTGIHGFLAKNDLINGLFSTLSNGPTETDGLTE